MASEKAVALFVGAGSALGEAALQLSGYQNAALAVILGIVAVLGIGYGGILYFGGMLKPNADSSSYKRWKRRMSAFIHALPIVGILVGGGIFVASIAWILSDNRRANEEIAQTLSRYVLPRHLSEGQISVITKYLQQYPAHDVKFTVIKNNEEASSYMNDFRRALTDAGWNVVGIDYSDDIREGVTTKFIQTSTNSQARSDPKNPKQDELFRQALKQAKLNVIGAESGSGANVAENSFVINIGRRRMDDGDLVGRQRLKERARKVLEDTDDGRPF